MPPSRNVVCAPRLVVSASGAGARVDNEKRPPVRDEAWKHRDLVAAVLLAAVASCTGQVGGRPDGGRGGVAGAAGAGAAAAGGRGGTTMATGGAGRDGGVAD